MEGVAGVVAMLTLTLDAVLPDNVTVDGVKLQLSPEGSPEHEKDTGPLKPLLPVRDIDSVPLCPLVIAIDLDGDVKLKSGEPVDGVATAIEPKRPSFSPLMPAAKYSVFGSPTPF